MKCSDFKETSKLAKASLFCALVSIACIILFGLFCMVTLDIGHFIAAAVVVALISFILGIGALVLITLRHKELKGYLYAVSGITLCTPLLLVMVGALYTTRVRAERSKENTGEYNLVVLGRSLQSYAKANGGYLPLSDQWADLLMQHDPQLTKGNFKHPQPDRFQLKGVCHFALNRYVGGKRLADIPGNVVLLFEADGDWNLNGTGELLKTRYRERGYVTLLFVDQSKADYWYCVKTIRKFNKHGMYYEQPRWSP